MLYFRVNEINDSGRIGGDGVYVELLTTKNFTEVSKYNYLDGDRKFEFKFLGVTWESEPDVHIFERSLPDDEPSKEEIIKFITKNVKNNSVVVAPEKLFQMVGGIKTVLKEVNDEASLDDHVFQIKSIENLRLSVDNQILIDLKNEMADDVARDKSVCKTFVFRYIFYRFYKTKRMNRLLQTIAEQYQPIV